MKYIVVVLALVVAGCGTRATPLSGVHYEARADAHPIDIFYGEDKPTRPYDQIAVIEKEAFWGWSGSGEVVENLKRKARELGGDGIILAHVQDSTYWSMTQDKKAQAKGVVVRYR